MDACKAAIFLAASLLPTTAFAAAGPDEVALSRRLPVGATERRSSFDGTLTEEDRQHLRALEIQRMTAAAVVIHKIPKRSEAELGQHLGGLTRSVERFLPSGVCGSITRTGDGTGNCTGSAPGPFGRAPLRMPFAITLSHEPGGAFHLLFTNTRSLEAKPFLEWTPVVYAGRLKVLVDFHPAHDGWLVYTRMGVEMKKHESAARPIVDAMFSLDAWLAREVGGR